MSTKTKVVTFKRSCYAIAKSNAALTIPALLAELAIADSVSAMMILALTLAIGFTLLMLILGFIADEKDG